MDTSRKIFRDNIFFLLWERQSLEDARSLMENFIAKEKTSV